MYEAAVDISSRLSRSPEAFASELLENLGENYPQYYMQSDKFSTHVQDFHNIIVCYPSFSKSS